MSLRDARTMIENYGMMHPRLGLSVPVIPGPGRHRATAPVPPQPKEHTDPGWQTIRVLLACCLLIDVGVAAVAVWLS